MPSSGWSDWVPAPTTRTTLDGGSCPGGGCWSTTNGRSAPIDLSSDPSLIADSLVGARLFSGYAGWDADQLEAEIDEGSWYVVPAEARDPISADPEGLWRRVLRRQGGAQAVVSGFPDDPAMN